MPFVLEAHWQTQKVAPVIANKNVAELFKTMQHLRNPSDIDSNVVKGYNYLYEAVYLHSEDYHFERLILPEGSREGDKGYSYLGEEKAKKKTKFLNDFYSINRTVY